MPHPVCGIELGIVDGEKGGRVVQDEVLGPPGQLMLGLRDSLW